MSVFTKILQVSCFISSLLACTGPSREQSQHIPPQKLPISYTPMELDSLYEPLYRDSFILQEKHDEFRHPVEQQFPMEQRLAHNTWILEFTWRIKADSLITVWYIREADTLKRLRYFRYSEFDIF